MKQFTFILLCVAIVSAGRPMSSHGIFLHLKQQEASNDFITEVQEILNIDVAQLAQCEDHQVQALYKLAERAIFSQNRLQDLSDQNFNTYQKNLDKIMNIISAIDIFTGQSNELDQEFGPAPGEMQITSFLQAKQKQDIQLREMDIENSWYTLKDEMFKDLKDTLKSYNLAVTKVVGSQNQENLSSYRQLSKQSKTDISMIKREVQRIQDTSSSWNDWINRLSVAEDKINLALERCTSRK